MSDKEYGFDKLVNKPSENKSPKYFEITGIETLMNNEGKSVTFEGTMARIPWQHMINHPDTHPNHTYINIGDNQIVVYSKDYINCKDKIKVFGTVIKVQGKSKRPGSGDLFTEYQVVADKWECVKYGS
jgi:hypothetical protein